MKKYCLTKCAKDKLHNGWIAFIEIMTGVLFIAIFIIACTIIFTALGWIYFMIIEYFNIEFLSHLLNKDMTTTGLALTLVIAFITFLSYGVFLFLKYIYLGVRSIVTNQVHKYKGEPYEKCKIFEECKE